MQDYDRCKMLITYMRMKKQTGDEYDIINYERK